jgi:uncharacterized protein YhfF
MTIETWRFGNTDKEADDLFHLVYDGKKTAISSIYSGTDIPKVGERSYITNSKGNSKVLIEITDVSIKRFSEIDKDHAQKEGEGDLSLTYWKETHKKFFTEQLAKKGKKFAEDIQILCEEFKVIEYIYLKTPSLEELNRDDIK